MSFLITSWDALSLFPYLMYNNFMNLNEDGIIYTIFYESAC